MMMPQFQFQFTTSPQTWAKKIPAKPLLLLFLSSALLLFLFLDRTHHHFPTPTPTLHLPLPAPTVTTAAAAATTSVHHLVFGIASSAKSFPRRSDYLRRWWDPPLTRGYVFLDSPSRATRHVDKFTLPSVRVSADTSRLPFTFRGRGGLRSAVRVARVVKDVVSAVDLERLKDVRWIVLGDDDTVFFPENLAATLAKYDWRRWYYVGGLSEMVGQNQKYSFDMAFGGGGFALSWPLARVLAGVLDSCLVRYAHLYGSDARVSSCLAELGVGLTHESGFHQVDLHGDIFGMLSAHPLTPLVSLHHLDYVEPIFPGMNRVRALTHLFEAVKVDPGRVLQQSVCYDRVASRTVSISWGYAIQVFEGNQLLPDLLSWQHTFTPWKRSRDISVTQYMFNTREFPKDPCKKPAIFFLERLISNFDGIQSNYTRHDAEKCLSRASSADDMKQIKVFSQKLALEIGELQALRRHCCDVLSSSSEKVMEIGIRKCKDNELITMPP